MVPENAFPEGSLHDNKILANEIPRLSLISRLKSSKNVLISFSWCLGRNKFANGPVGSLTAKADDIQPNHPSR